MNVFDDALLKRFVDSTAAVSVTGSDTLLIHDAVTGTVLKIPVSVLISAFTASAPVQSVAGKTGIVSLTASDVGLSIGVTGTKTTIASLTVTNGIITAWS